MSIYLGNTPLADGASTALLAGKADTNLGNAIISSTFATKLNSAGIRTVTQTYKNGTSWYRVWSDGWIEQGGQSSNTSTINFLKAFAEKPTVSTTLESTSFSNNTSNASHGFAVQAGCLVYSVSTTQMTFQNVLSVIHWEAKGYIR